MPRASVLIAVIALTAGTGLATVGAQRPGWPPPVQQVSQESPALSPADELKTFVLPPGYRAELVASEPMIEEPIVIDWDADGRLWVVELRGYMHDLPATNEREPLGRVSVLEDTNNDGRMDRKTIFLDGLVSPRAVKVLSKGVLVAEPPHLWFAQDTNGDLKADKKDLVCDCYGQAMANVEHNANSLLWALDNSIYTSETDVFLRWKNGAFETRKTLSRGQWGAAQDDAGRVYRNSNESALHVDLVPTPYYARNPDQPRTRGSYEYMGDPAELNVTWPLRPTPGVNRGYVDGQLRPDGTLATYTAVCSPIVYRGDRLPRELYGNVFVAEPAGNLVSRMIVDDNGRTLRARKAYDRAEFMSSTDERFRPVYLSAAPDGAIYVVDIYHGIIQHRGYITEYLRDQILARKLEAPIHKGRIFRIVHEATRRDARPALSAAAPAKLVETLSHPNGWWRDTAQRLLVERADKSVVPALTRIAESGGDARTRLHALWVLDGLDSLPSSLVIKVLEDPNRDIRVSALRLAERWLADDRAIQAAVMKRLDDTDWAVREQLAATLGSFPQGTRENAIAAVLERYGNDPVAIDAAISGARGAEVAVLDQLMQQAAQSPERDAAITMLAATVVRGAQDAPVQALFQRAADPARAEWQRSALLRGAEVTLLGAAMPGAAPGRGRGAGGGGGNAPGQRGGPGGAPAFPDASRGANTAPEGGAPARGRGRGNAQPALKLTRPPAIETLASGSNDLGTRAAALLARIEWPGKPGIAAAVAPLTAIEQRRFDQGRELYRNVCQPCHQADGRGQEKLAPTLIGSQLALGPPGVAARILLNGKEGKVGLMPPLGAGMSDEEIAAVLTYTRREWNQTGAPVDPASVKDARAATAARTRPWTDDELLAVLRGGGGRP